MMIGALGVLGALGANAFAAGAGVPAVYNLLLMETGSVILAENGDRLALES